MVMLVNTAVDVFMFIITIMFLKDTKTPISAPPDFESNKARRIVHRIISLDDLKFVKNAMNVDLANMMEEWKQREDGVGEIGFVTRCYHSRFALRDNPLDYVKEAKATVDCKKRSFEALSTLIMAELLIKFFGIKALMINFQSYINKMIIVVSVDENAIPDPHQLLDDFEDSLNLIKNAVIERGLVKNLK
uniref:Wax synthase n=1 Tax=Solanum tuberosum TaxID=4113 RepID=M1BMN0_SOLTU